MKLDTADIVRVYIAGLNLARDKRAAGKNDEATRIEAWIIALCKRLEEVK